jgi:predicted ATP-dependent endonuclease of OLD family
MKYNISHIYLHNFQSIEGPVRIDFSPITFLYGPNSSGKSAIYDAIKIALNLCAGDGYDDTKKLIAKFMHMHNFKNKMIIGMVLWLNFHDFTNRPRYPPTIFWIFCLLWSIFFEEMNSVLKN